MIVTMEIPTIDRIHIAVVVVVGVIITMVIVVVVTIIQETIIITVVVREVDGRIIFVAKINLNNNNTTLISSKIAITNEICHDHDRRPMTNDVVIDRRRLLEWRERERHDFKKVGGFK